MRQLNNIRRRCTLVAPIALVGIALAVLHLGRIRVSRVYVGGLEWENGWPCGFLNREVRRAVPGGDPFGGSTILRFRPWVAVADAFVALGLIGAAAWAAWRRSRSRRPFQFGLRGLLLAVTAVAMLLGSALHHHRREQRVVDGLGEDHFGFQVDEGLPHVLRRYLPGGRLRLFDRIAMVEIVGPGWAGERLEPLANLRDVVWVEVMSNELDDRAVKHISNLRRLVFLRANGNNRVTDAGVKYLGTLEELRELDIAYSQVTDAGLALLTRLKRLESLDLHGVKEISDAGLVHLRGLRSLKSLVLYGTGVSDAGANTIADLPNLEKLHLAETQLTDAGLMRLSALAHLTLIDIRNTQVTDDGIARFKRALPSCLVIR